MVQLSGCLAPQGLVLVVVPNAFGSQLKASLKSMAQGGKQLLTGRMLAKHAQALGSIPRTGKQTRKA